MNKGDRMPVSIDGAVVGYAEVENITDTEVTLLIPAQRIVAAKRVEVDLSPAEVEPEKETIITGVDRAEATTPPEPGGTQTVNTPEGKTTETITTPGAEQIALETATVEEVGTSG